MKHYINIGLLAFILLSSSYCYNQELISEKNKTTNSNSFNDAYNYIKRNKHFKAQKPKYYNLYHSNVSARYINSQPDNDKLSQDDFVVMRIKNEDNNNTLEIGLEGTLNIITDYNDTEMNIFDIDDIEEKTSFETILLDENNNEYNTKCRLWKPENEKIRLFCNLQRIYKYAKHNLTLPEVSLIYNNYNVSIIPECSIIINQLTYNIPFSIIIICYNI